jgi:CubicO group peptidase (beta-lactamase class C family)
MIKQAVHLVTALALLLAAPAFAADTLDERIARVENGLLPKTVIKGHAVTPAKIAERMVAAHVPGVSVAVINNGTIEWARGYGVTEAGGKQPVTTDTLFQAASISKPVAAMAALRLVEQGKLSLDKDINAYLTGWQLPQGAQTTKDRVNLRRLLNHSAGTSVHGFEGYADGESVPSLVQLLDGAKPANSEAVRVTMKPGAQWEYSGGGISIAQLAMTSASGKPFAALMKESVLDPLGMIHSTYEQPLPAALHTTAASAHDSSGAPIKGKWHTYPEQAAAGLWTTPSDLARFAIELQQAYAGKSSKVISKPMAAQMLTRLKGSYGLGIGVDKAEEGLAAFSHGGSNQGFKTMMYAFTTTGQGAVVMTNGDNGDALTGDIFRSIAKVYGWKDWRVIEKPVVAVGAATLAAYEAKYKLDSMEIKVSNEGGRLFITAPPLGPDPQELFPSSATRFFLLTDDTEFAFNKDKSGKFDLVIHRGKPRRAKRVL